MPFELRQNSLLLPGIVSVLFWLRFCFKFVPFVASGRLPWRHHGKVGSSLALVEVRRSALALLRLNGRSLEGPWASLEVLEGVLEGPGGRLVDPQVPVEFQFGLPCGSRASKFKTECR